MVRIIAGRWGGRRIAVPAQGTRPTADRVREAVFSSLALGGGEQVLDLFAGSGANGFEALSRGAAGAVLVESDRGAQAVIRSNAEVLEAGPAAELVGSDWKRACSGLSGRRFDVVFVDPPWQDCEAVGAALADVLGPLLADGATVVCESPADAPMEVDLPLLRQRRYGGTLIRFHERS